MPRKVHTTADKTREARQVRNAFDLWQGPSKERTQEDLAALLNVTQGLIYQWLSGKTRIPDLQLLKLGKFPNFSAFSVRPSLVEYAEFFHDSDGLLDGLSEQDRQRVKQVIAAFKEPLNRSAGSN